jgi:lipopolysaccharide assembly outer membrane protein LptD (OstA)
MPAALRRSLALLIVCAWASAVAAQQSDDAGKSRGFGEEPVEITADALDYDAAQEQYVASGNVVLHQGARTLRADSISFNRRTGDGVASGNVELREAEEVVRADTVQFNVGEEIGVVQNGTIDSPAGQFIASGEEIRKTGPHSYTFRGAVFTTCRCPKEGREPWQIRAREADIEIGGYGVVRDATFDVLGIPALWVPWLIVPIRTERQSGFLLPEVSAGTRQGFQIGVPFFWAVRDNVNATFTPYYSVRRGFKQDAKFEYLFGKESSGDLFAAFAYDQEVDPDSQNEPYNKERWAVIGNQNYRLPADWLYRSDFRFVSDNDYPIDYQELRARRADRWLQSWALLGRSFGNSGRWMAEGSSFYANDMQSPDDVDRDDTVLNRLPELAFAGLPGPLANIPWLRPSFDAAYVFYDATDRTARPQPDPGFVTASVPHTRGFQDTGTDGVFDSRESSPPPAVGVDPHHDNFDPATNPEGTERDGHFQEGEPLSNEGSRIRLSPRLAMPFTLADVLEVYPEAGWSETLYDTRFAAFDHRELFTGRVDMRTRLLRRFGDVTHVIEPVVGYAYVQSVASQSDNPLFTPATAVPQQRVRDLDLASVTYDPADRISSVNRLTWGAVQRVRMPIQGSEVGLDAELTLLGSYELDQDQFGWVIADGALQPSRYGGTRFHVSYDPEKNQIQEGLVEWNWRHPDGHRLGLGYRYLRDIPQVFEDWQRGERFDNFSAFDHINQVFADARVQVTKRWLLGYKTAFSFNREVFLQNSGMIEYLSTCGCWAAGIELSQDRASGVNVRVNYRLVGIGDDLAKSPLLDALEGL